MRTSPLTTQRGKLDTRNGRPAAVRKGAESDGKAAGAPKAKPAYRPFAAELRRLLNSGTRATPKPGQAGTPWSPKEFGGAERGERTVRNYLNAETLPDVADLAWIDGKLFGADAAAQAARGRLRDLWRQAGGGAPAAPLATGSAIPRPDRFIGRDDALAELVAALTAPGPVAVVVLGEGGMGKTTLARQAANAEALAARFGARRFEAPLDAARTTADLQARIAVAAGADPARGFPATVAALGAAPALLLLDNLESCWEAEAEAVEAVLRQLAAVPGLALLATLRGREAPRAPRWSKKLQPEPLTEDAARTLFLDIAEQYRDDPDLDALLVDLGGLPLAVTLVAWRAEPDSLLAPLLAEWRRAGVAAARDARAAPGARQGSLAQSIEFSLASPRLGPEGRRLFSLLGALPAGLSPADATALLGDEEPAAREQLLGVALAHRRGDRLDLLPPLRRHAAAAHPPRGGDAGGWAKHFLALTSSFQESFAREGGVVVARLGSEIPNIEAALRLAAADPALLPAAIASTWTFAMVCRFTGQGGGALRDFAAACAAAGNARAEAMGIQQMADVALARSEHDAAWAGFEAARELYAQMGYIPGEASCIASLANIALQRSGLDAARMGYEVAQHLFAEAGDVQGEANCIASLADISLRRSEHEAATTGYSRARLLYAQVGDILGEANCIQGVADIALRQSQYEAARAGYEASLLLYSRMGDPVGEANCIKGLADLALIRTEYDAARSGYRSARMLYARVGAMWGEATCLAGLADIARAQGNRAEARQIYTAALAIENRIGDAHNAAITRERLAALDAAPPSV